MSAPLFRALPRIAFPCQVVYGALAALVGASGLACGPPAKPVAVAAAEGLPSYTAEEAALFDDTIDLTVFGRAPTIRPNEDPKLPERVKHAESVILAKVATVTSERGQSSSPFYQLAFKAVAPALSGTTPTEPVVVRIAPNNPSYQFVVLTDAGLVGRIVVLLFKRYKEAGETVLHWHVESDTPEVRSVIERAKFVAPSTPKPADGRRRDKESP